MGRRWWNVLPYTSPNTVPRCKNQCSFFVFLPFPENISSLQLFLLQPWGENASSSSHFHASCFDLFGFVPCSVHDSPDWIPFVFSPPRPVVLVLYPKYWSEGEILKSHSTRKGTELPLRFCTYVEGTFGFQNAWIQVTYPEKIGKTLLLFACRRNPTQGKRNNKRIFLLAQYSVQYFFKKQKLPFRLRLYQKSGKRKKSSCVIKTLHVHTLCKFPRQRSWNQILQS